MLHTETVFQIMLYSQNKKISEYFEVKQNAIRDPTGKFRYIV